MDGVSEHTTPAAAPMLSPYRVLDLTDSRAELATFVMAGLGADVIKVEPPGGAESRHAAPRVPDEQGPDGLTSLRFHAFNRGKRSVILDLDRPEGRDDFLALVATADFVFENAGPGVLEVNVGSTRLSVASVATVASAAPLPSGLNSVAP